MYLKPNKTFDQALEAEGEDKLHVILVPGGAPAEGGPGNTEARKFMKEIVPELEHVLTGMSG